MKNLSEKAQDLYENLKSQGFDDKSIKLAMEDGEALGRIGLGDDDQATIEELHAAL